MALKICFISLLHRHDDTRVFYKEARSLAKAGFEVVHLASGKIPSYIKDGVRVEIYHSYDRKGVKGRFGKFIPLYKQAVAIDADCYHCNELESWPIGWLIKLLHPSKKIIFDVHEYYPGKFENPIFPRWLDKLAHPSVKLLYRMLSPKTDHFILVNPAFATDFPVAKEKITTIYNYGFLEMQSKTAQAVSGDIKRKFSENPTAIHVGGFGRSRGWPQLLEALCLMKNKNLTVLCLGDLGSEKEEILSNAKRLGVEERIRIEPRVAYEEMFDYLLCANVGLILFQPGMQNHVLSFPQKLLDYMLAGLPVIAPNFAVDINKVIQKEGCGITINPSNPEEIAGALDWICENPSLAEEMGKRGRQAIITEYNWDREAEKLVRLYKEFEKEITGQL